MRFLRPLRYHCFAWALPLLLVAVAGPACIVGTWPTPEETQGGGSDTMPIGNEVCDGLDNDGDGTVDEACACSVDGQQRGCAGLAADASQCGLGVQLCSDGAWSACTHAGPPFTAPRVPHLGIVAIDPMSVQRDSTALIAVSVEPTARCQTYVLPAVAVSIAAADPVMRVRGWAVDDGSAADVIAGDGIFTVALPNPFGPGVAAQNLTVRAWLQLDEQEVEASMVIPLVVP